MRQIRIPQERRALSLASYNLFFVKIHQHSLTKRTLFVLRRAQFEAFFVKPKLSNLIYLWNNAFESITILHIWCRKLASLFHLCLLKQRSNCIFHLIWIHHSKTLGKCASHCALYVMPLYPVLITCFNRDLRHVSLLIYRPLGLLLLHASGLPWQFLL